MISFLVDLATTVVASGNCNCLLNTQYKARNFIRK